jgi:MoxR-like ATPase
MQGRLNASFEDVQALAGPVLQHRVILDYSARLDGRDSPQVISQLIQEVPVRAGDLPKSLRESAPASSQ